MTDFQNPASLLSSIIIVKKKWGMVTYPTFIYRASFLVKRSTEQKIWEMFQNGDFDEEIATMSMFMNIPEADPSWFDPDTPLAA